MQNTPKRKKNGRRNGRGTTAIAVNPQAIGTPQQPRNNGNGGNARQKYERYMVLARDAAAAGDEVEAENLFQHAEHYLRTMREQQA